MKKLTIIFFLFIQVISYAQSTNLSSNSTKKEATSFTYLKQKLNLSLAINGDFVRTLGNTFVFFWNAGMRYEKDSDGNRIVDFNGDYVLVNPNSELEFSKNIIGGELKLDYNVNNDIVVSSGIYGAYFPEEIYGLSINNTGYFCETQIKAGKGTDIYLFGQFGLVNSTFSENVSLNHYKYATGLGIGNDYVGLDVGLNFFSTPTEKKELFLQDYAYASSAENYLDSTRVTIRLTAKFL